MKKILYILVFILSASGFAQNESLFDQGKSLYRDGKHQEAVTAWMKILDKKEHSSALYFNLGNAHYKLNHIGPSIYYYEKALQLSPNDSDIKNNLAFAQNATVDAIEPLPERIFSTWYKKLSGVLSYNGWAGASILFSLGFILLFLFYYFSFSEGKKRTFFVISLVSLLLLFVSIGMAFSTFNDYKKDQPAIIFSESVEVKSEPTMGSEVAFNLHEGTKVRILTREENWAKIVIADGKDGWIPLSDLKEL